MARQKTPVLTEAEHRVMRALWAHGEASARTLTETLSRKQPLAYNTVLTTLTILTKKGYVRAEPQGRAFMFVPLVTRSKARSQALKNVLLQFFENSPEALAQHLVQDTNLDVEELRALIEKARAARRSRK